MGGWGRRFLNVTPAGTVLPCHAAETLPGLRFPNVGNASLTEIWHTDPSFVRFRGTDWMPEPCSSCERRQIDWAGCRCQAFALTGEASRTDPVCFLSPDHDLMISARAEGAPQSTPNFVYRQYSTTKKRSCKRRQR